MALGRVAAAVRIGLGALFAAQVATVAGLAVVHRQRKKFRRHAGFPSAPPVEVGVGEVGDVTVYTKGRDLYDAMLEAIDAAEHTVLLETYIWKGDRVGQQFKDALVRAVERGVEVYVVYDGFANLVVPRQFLEFDPRIEVLVHQPWTGIRSPLSRGPGLNHRKMVVVDGEIGFVGGYNLGSLYATQWRDTHLRVRGPATADLENAFVDYWNTSRRKDQPELPQPGSRPWSATIRVVRNVPSVGVYPIRYMYLEAIDRARERVWLTHAYLIPDDDLTYALTEAADRGADVRIIVPAESNHIVADWLSRGFYRRLLRGGVRLFLYQNAMVHAKTATIDGEWSTVGTANLDRLSLTGNYEVNVEVLDAALASRMEDIFTMDSGNCVELTLQEWERRHPAAKVSEALLTPLRPLL